MKIIFTDIDGVLQINNPKKWNKKCCKLYSDVCNDLNLKCVITSTWRVRYNLKELQEIFYSQGINVEIIGTTEILGIDRGEEILMWLTDNSISEYVVIDDNVRDILPFVKNVVKIEKSYDGLTEKNIKEIRKYFE